MKMIYLLIWLVIPQFCVARTRLENEANFPVLEVLLADLDRRVKSLEQPAWEVMRSDKRWMVCSEGPCRKCSLETRSLTCWRQGLKTLPRFQAIPFDIQAIDLSKNEINSLNKNSFHELSYVTDLDLSHNRLNYLPESIFESLTSLRNLNMRFNELVQLPEFLLYEQSQLEILDLSENRLVSLDSGFLSMVRKLRALNLSLNRLDRLPAGLLGGGLGHLEELHLTGNGLTELEADSFRGLGALRLLDVARNNLTHLPHGLFRDTKALEVLRASSNRLTRIEADFFAGLPSLALLDLTANLISGISGIELSAGLRELHLGQNRLHRPPDSRQPLGNLTRLFLFSNQLRELGAHSFSAFPRLRTLTLNHNLIAHLEEGTFKPLRHLTNLQLDSNKLTHLPENCFRESSMLSGVKLTKNPWHCDCTIHSFSQWLKENKEKIWGSEPTCLGPGELGGRPISEVSYEELCERKVEEESSEEARSQPLRGATQRDIVPITRGNTATSSRGMITCRGASYLAWCVDSAGDHKSKEFEAAFPITYSPPPNRSSESYVLNGSLLNYLADLDEYRYSFPVTVFFCVAYSLVFVIGVSGNLLVVSVVLRSPRMRSPTNMFIANLALADLLVNFICLPFTLAGNVHVAWKMGWLICKTVPYLQGVSVNASVNTLVAISVERCLAICYPMKFRINSRVVKLTVLIIWCISLSITLPWALYFKHGALDEEARVHTCTEEWPDPISEKVYFIVAHLFMCYFLPLIMITFCYLLIWRKVSNRSLIGETHAHGEQVIQKSKMKVIKMLLVVVILFTCSWLPLYIICTRVKLFGDLGPMETQMIEVFLPIAQWLGTSNSCINPILYAFFNKKFRAGFQAIISSRSCCSTLRYDYRAQLTITKGDANGSNQKVPTKRQTVSGPVVAKPKKPDPSLRTMSLRTPVPSNNNFQDLRNACHDLTCNGTFV